MSEQKIKVGVSQGDVNGVGLEVILKTFSNPEMLELCTPVLFSSQRTFSFYKKILGIEELSVHQVRDATIVPKRLNLFSCYEEEIAIEPGKPTEMAGKYALKSLEAASDAISKGITDVLVTAPVNKHTIKGENFNFNGHTEYLAQKFGNGKSMMMMVAESFRVALATGHIPLALVAQELTGELITGKIKMLARSLTEDFSIRKPRIAVLGLNPHAGDNGTLGKEEQDIIIPAIEKAKENTFVMGPYSADGFFGAVAYRKFDAVLAMYHDQGLIPFKTLAFEKGVNYTAGLSIVRTSPDHGTAYDIAGKNQASEESFRNAVYLACDLYNRRKENRKLTSNALVSETVKKQDAAK